MTREEREEAYRLELWKHSTLGIPAEALVFYLILVVGFVAFLQEVF